MRIVASIEEVAAGVRATLRQVADACAALRSVVAPIEEAGRAYARLGKGSQRTDLADAAACLRAAYDQCREIVATLGQVTDRANAYLASTTGKLIPDQVETLRRELPPPIPAAERGTGRKTHGRWVGADGVPHEIVSGEDVLSANAVARFRSLGYRRLWIADHVEIKLAEMMCRQHNATGQPQHATLVANQVPCGGTFGCAEVLPVMLPEGCSLTVYAPQYKRTFTGGATP
jgi:hypothetical protein